MNVFDLQGTIKLDTGDYDSKLSASEGKATGFASKLGAGLGTVGKVAGAAMAAAGTAIVGFGASSVKTGAEFDSAMSQVAATMGTTVDQIGDLRDYAQEMGATTAFSATQSAEALNYMALAGYDAETSMKMLPNVLNLAASGGMELATASDMVTDAQSALGLTLDETNTMVDQMAKTASTTNTSVEQLGSAFLTVGGTARNLKGGTAELSQALGILADNGIKGAEGGTKLRNMILSLSAPTDNARDVLDQLGVSAFDANGEMRPLQDTFMDLNKAMEGMTTEEKTQALNTIFNKADLKAVNALLGTNADRWDEVAEKIGDCEGAAEAMANTQLDNLQGDITLFKSAWEGLQIAISDKVTPALRDFVKIGADGISEITKAIKSGDMDGAFEAFGKMFEGLLQKITELIPQIVELATRLLIEFAKALIQQMPNILKSVGTALTSSLKAMFKESFLAGAGAVAGLVGLLFNPVVKGVKTAVKAFGAIRSAVQIFTGALSIINPVVLIVVGVLAALVAAGIAVYKNWDTIKAKAQEFGQTVSKAWNDLKESVSEAWNELKENASEAWQAISQTVTDNWNAAIEGIQSTIAGIGEWFSGIGETISSAVGEAISGAGEWFAGLGEAISGVFSNAVEWFSGIGQGLSTALSNAWNTAVTWLSTIWGSFVEWASNMASGFMGRITALPSQMGQMLSQMLQTAIQWLTTLVQTAIQKASEFVTNFVSKAAQLPSQFLGAITPAIQNVIQWGSEIASNAKNKITETANNVVTFASQIPSQLLGAITPAIQNVIQWGSQLVSNAKAKASEMGSQMISALSGIPSQFFSIGSNIIRSLISGIGSMVGSLYSSIHSALSGLVGKAKAALGIGSPSKVFKQIGKWTSEGMKIGWQKDFPETQKKIATDLENLSGVAVATPTVSVVANAKKALTSITRSIRKKQGKSSDSSTKDAKKIVTALTKSLNKKSDDSAVNDAKKAITALTKQLRENQTKTAKAASDEEIAKVKTTVGSLFKSMSSASTTTTKKDNKTETEKIDKAETSVSQSSFDRFSSSVLSALRSVDNWFATLSDKFGEYLNYFIDLYEQNTEEQRAYNKTAKIETEIVNVSNRLDAHLTAVENLQAQQTAAMREFEGKMTSMLQEAINSLRQGLTMDGRSVSRIVDQQLGKEYALRKRLV